VCAGVCVCVCVTQCVCVCAAAVKTQWGSGFQAQLHAIIIINYAFHRLKNGFGLSLMELVS
jgi:hypothetical protein